VSHVYHGDLRGILFREGCEECEARVNEGIYGLFHLDFENLVKLARLATEQKLVSTDERKSRRLPTENPDLSYLDKKAIEYLRAAGRLTFRSGISQEVCE